MRTSGTTFAVIVCVSSLSHSAPSAVLALIFVAACGDNSPIGADAATDAAATVGQGSEPQSDLIITELAPRGEGPDWVELRNRSQQAIDLCDFFLTDSVDRLDHYQPLGGAAPPDSCEPRLLSPGEFIVVNADDDAPEGLDHAPFKLGVADEVHIIDLSGRAVDSLVYLLSDGQTSLARVPTDSGLFFSVAPSPGEPNPEGMP